MTENDKFQITIRVADIPEFTLTIKRTDEEFYRKAVMEVNQLWSNWKLNLKNPDSKRILAVIALKFAKQFYDASSMLNKERNDQALKQDEVIDLLDGFEKEMDKILINLNNE